MNVCACVCDALTPASLIIDRKSKELDKELRAVGLNLKSLEVNEEQALHRESAFGELVHCLQGRVKEVHLHGSPRFPSLVSD